MLHTLPDKYLSSEWEQLPDERAAVFEELFPRLVSAIHHCFPTLASRGVNLIADHVIQSASWLEECVDLLADFPVTFVGVRCSLEASERREQDHQRIAGLARAQLDAVHSQAIYDGEVDTCTDSPEECAAQIIRTLREHPSGNAFARWKETMPRRPPAEPPR